MQLVLRFANRFFLPLWNRDNIDNVQVRVLSLIMFESYSPKVRLYKYKTGDKVWGTLYRGYNLIVPSKLHVYQSMVTLIYKVVNSLSSNVTWYFPTLVSQEFQFTSCFYVSLADCVQGGFRDWRSWWIFWWIWVCSINACISVGLLAGP
jgi:hypothetical protein